MHVKTGLIIGWLLCSTVQADCLGITKDKATAHLEAAALEFKVDPLLLHAMVVVESHFNNCAVSPAGASGLLQLMPKTAKAYDVQDVFDARQNIRGATAYLAELIQEFEIPQLYLAAYNAGETAVKRKGYIPNYTETRAYIRKVLKVYQDIAGISEYEAVQLLTKKGKISYEYQ